MLTNSIRPRQPSDEAEPSKLTRGLVLSDGPKDGVLLKFLSVLDQGIFVVQYQSSCSGSMTGVSAAQLTP